MRVAQKLLGALTIDGGCAQARGGGRGSQRSQIRTQAARNVQNIEKKKQGFPHLLT